MRWRQFCAELLAACDELGGELVVTLGALLADTPHTRPIPVTGTATEPELVDRLKLEQSTYEGPTGIVGVFQDACVRLDIPAVSYWAAVPHYVAQPPCPKATLALLGQLEDLLEIEHPARRPARGGPGLGARRRRARRGGRGHRRLRPRPRGDPGHHRPARGLRRGDRPRVRALPQARADADDEQLPVGGLSRPRATRPSAASSEPASIGRRPASRVGGRRPGRRCRAWRRPRRRPPRARAGRRGRRPARRARLRRPGRPGRRRPATSARATRRASSTAAQSSVVGPLPVAAVVVAQQGQPDRHRVDVAVRRAETKTRLPLRLRHLLAVVADHPGVDVGLRERRARARPPGPRPAHISWCGKTRSLPPPWTSKARAEVLQRDRGALDVPARAGRGPNGLSQAGSPGALAAPQQAVERVLLAGAVGVAAALGEDLAASARGSSRRPHRTRGRR